ncbi:hypothetical protein [Streptomyces sp. NPDC012508]|uniref:hypothetical protein n=1 Tax=Streptomyces sp. NPDC012508 TaxID=3364837 RepID=UPI0036CCF64B
MEKTADALSHAALVASARMEGTDRPDPVRVITDGPGAQAKRPNGCGIGEVRAKRRAADVGNVGASDMATDRGPPLATSRTGADQDDVSLFERRTGSAGEAWARRRHL